MLQIDHRRLPTSEEHTGREKLYLGLFSQKLGLQFKLEAEL
jgi:hypothetical protein